MTRITTTTRQREARGFALIMVMIMITVLAILAGAFAFSMKVEHRLAGNANSDSEMEWLGRSGVELARFVLANSGDQGGPGMTSLNQIWAGGPGSPGETNGPLADISLKNNRLGDGTFSIEIEDLERKWNINVVDQLFLGKALLVMGADTGLDATVSESVLDWRDRDDRPHMSGTESEFYLTLDPPYAAKNGPIDDIRELLLVRGVTPELFWGPEAAQHRHQLLRPDRLRPREDEMITFPTGLKDLFTPLSMGRLNINTAPRESLQLLPGVDENVAGNIIRARAGLDGAEGTEDDTPFSSPGSLAGLVPGIAPELQGMYTQLTTVRSATFEVTVDAQIGNYRKQFRATLLRPSRREVSVVQFSWD